MNVPRGKKALNIDLPIELHDILKKVAIENGLTVTAVIVQYIQYLRQKRYNQRKALNGKSKANFTLDGKPTGELHGTDQP